MTYTPEYLINKRKEKWFRNQDIEQDKLFREAIATELIENREFLEGIKKNPELLIELTFVVVDKKQKTVPFFFNEVQKHFINILNKAIQDFNNGKITEISMLVLKGRQQGFTTLITAYQLASIILNKNFAGLTIADESKNTENIFQSKAKFPFEQLPQSIKPTEKYNNIRQLFFEKLNSNWSIDTATKDVGRSRTINFFHGSECAFWNFGMENIQSGLGEAFTRNCIKIYESTANGFNDFNKMWTSENHINCFYEWWKTQEYVTEFETDKIKEDFIKNIESSTEWIFIRLKWLKEEKELKLNQLYWYYKKYNSYIDNELIKQEYPCTPEEAFISTGRTYFKKENIIQRLLELKDKKSLKTGYFKYIIKNEKIVSYEWVEDKEGFIQIYEDVQEGYPYVLGGDTAGGGLDYFTGHVINNATGKQVAVLRQQFDEVEYTRQIYCLGMYYNKALVGLEINFSPYPTTKLQELKYPKLYVRRKEDSITKTIIRSYGFKTTSITRPLILALLQTIILENIDYIVDKNTLQEMLTFIINENSKPEAQIGYHDDLIIGLAITYYIRTHQEYTIKTVKNNENNQFNPLDGLYGEDNGFEGDFGASIPII